MSIGNGNDRIEKIKTAIISLDKAIELDKLKRKKMYELKYALIQEARALNPVFWLEGKKPAELLELYKEEMKLRIECGLKQTFEQLHGYQLLHLVKEDWYFIQKRIWEKNRANLKKGCMVV